MLMRSSASYYSHLFQCGKQNLQTEKILRHSDHFSVGKVTFRLILFWLYELLLKKYYK